MPLCRRHLPAVPGERNNLHSGSARLKVGDSLITMDSGEIAEERIEELERIEGVVRTVAIHVPGTNTYLADGVWTHNDAPTLSSSGPGISNSGGSSGLTILTTGSSSGSSSSGSKSSGSSFSGSSSIGVSNTGVSNSSGSGIGK